MKHVVRIREDADVEYPPTGSYRYSASNVQSYTEPAAGLRSLQDFKNITILSVRRSCYCWHFYHASDADLVISSEDALFTHAAFPSPGWAALQCPRSYIIWLPIFLYILFTASPST